MSEQKDDKLDDFEYYTMRFNIKDRPLDEDEEGYDLVHDFNGEIIRTDGTDETGGAEKNTVVGNVKGARIDLGEALERKVHPFNVFDLSGELIDYYSPFFDHDNGSFREDLELESLGDMLIVHSVEVIPESRGLNLGLLAMLQTVKTFGGGCALAAIKPFPLQFSGKVTPENGWEFTRGQNKLRAYWQRLGFKRVRRTEYYCIDLACRLPKPTKFLVTGAKAK